MRPYLFTTLITFQSDLLFPKDVVLLNATKVALSGITDIFCFFHPKGGLHKEWYISKKWQQITIEEIKKYKRELSDFSRFNQRIDVSNSRTVFKRWKKNPKEFKVYHHAYSQERKKWTVIPFKEIIKKIKGLTDRYLIGDFGCGEAFLYKEFGNRVTSIDMVAVGPEVSIADLSDVDAGNGEYS